MLKEKVIALLTSKNKPCTIAYITAELITDIEIQTYYKDKADLNKVLRNNIASSVRNWKGIVSMPIDGKIHLDYPEGHKVVDTIRFLYDGFIHAADVVVRRGAFIDVVMPSGIIKSIRKDTVL